jgi:hypothetical protein
MVLLELIIEAQRFTTLSGSLKRTYVFDQIGPLSEEEKLFISLLIDAFLMLCKKKVDLRDFQRRCRLSFCPTPPRGMNAPTTSETSEK